MPTALQRRVSYLLVGREDGKASARGLVLIRRAQGPEGNRATSKLGEPALQLRLCGVVRQAAQVQDLAALSQESAHISVRIHRAGQDLGVLVGRLRLADQAAEHASERDGLLHGTARGGRGQCLQVEGQVVLDGGGGLHGLHFEGGADVGEGAGTERQRLRVMSLPALILGAQVKGARVLQVGRQDDSLVAGLAGQLHPKIPGVQGHKGKLELFAGEVLLSKRIKPGDGIPESARRADMLPGESCQACCEDQMESAFDDIPRQLGGSVAVGRRSNRMGDREGLAYCTAG